MSSEEHHVALPKLYGAPAYARPRRPVEEVERPVDPDDLPLEPERTPEEQELASRMRQRTARASRPALGGGHDAAARSRVAHSACARLTGRLFGNS